MVDGMRDREREKGKKKKGGVEGSEGLKKGDGFSDAQMPRCPEFLNGLKREEVGSPPKLHFAARHTSARGTLNVVGCPSTHPP